MAKPLDNLVGARQLKAEPSSPAEIDALLKRAAGLLSDAGNPTLGPASRFSLAYDAAFALATAALRAVGYRVDASRGHRALVFQVLPHSIDAPAELWTALSAAHERRNAVEYSAALAPTVAEASDLAIQAKKLEAMLRARVGKSNSTRS
ncbi:MAG: hypothetical protein ACKVP2_06045 [Burkholderiales bacterium]